MSQSNINDFQTKIQEVKKILTDNAGAKVKVVSDKITSQLNEIEKFYNQTILGFENQLSKLPDLQKMNEDFKKKVIDIENNASKKVSDKIEEIDKKKKEEIETAKKYAIEKSISSAINVIDQLEIAISFAIHDPAVKNYVSGFKMVLDMFLKWLNELGIEQINIKPGDAFDEKHMSAIEKVASNFQKNHVVKVMKSGYTLYDKIIRHAAVSVSDGSQVTQSMNQNQTIQTVKINPTVPTTHLPTQQVYGQNNTQNLPHLNNPTKQQQISQTPMININQSQQNNHPVPPRPQQSNTTSTINQQTHPINQTKKV